jgi:UDP-glucose 4-epimerase
VNVFVTGSEGFIGRHVVRRLVNDHSITTIAKYDRAIHPADQIEQRDRLCDSMRGSDVVIHLAALADVRNALKQPVQQVQSNLILTSQVLEAMRATGVNRIVFMSTAVVYGDCTDSPITERATCFPQQTSIYGAMKLASESLIAAYCHGYGMTADIFRTVSLVGPGYRHGNLMDFYKKLKANPSRLEIYGTGQQQKYYIDVADVVQAIRLTLARQHTGAELWNISHDQPNTILDSIETVAGVLQAQPAIISVADPWAGDLPGLVLDCSKLRGIGWAPTVPIRQGMEAAVMDFVERGL